MLVEEELNHLSILTVFFMSGNGYMAIVSTHENYCHIAVLSKSIGDLQFLYLYQRLLDHLLQKLHRVLCLIFRVDRFQRRFFCITSIS